MKTWREGEFTIRKEPKADDLAKCSTCGKVGLVGKEVVIAWGMSVITSACKDCLKEEE